MKLRFFVSILLLFCVAIFSVQAATQCSAVFPDGVANSSINGKIKFENSSKLINNPDSILASANVDNTQNWSTSCQTQNVNCSAGGASSVVPPLTATYSGYSSSTNLTVQNGNVVTINTNNYRNVEVKSGSTLNMSTSFSTYRFRKLIVKETSIVNLTAGDYFFEELEIKSTSKLNVIGSGTVRIFVKNKIKLKESSTINGGISGNPAKLFVYFFANNGDKLEIKSGATFAGYIYSKNKVEIKGANTKVVGAISAAGELKLEDGATVTYNGSALANANLGSICSTTPTPVTIIANYRLDECSYTGAANEVIDQLGTYHGRSFGTLDTFAGGKIERAANINAGGHRIEVSVPLPSSYSVTSWFKKPTATNGNRYFILGSMAAGGDLLFLDRNNNWRWGVYNPVLGNKYGTFRFDSLDNNWHHLALVYSGSLTKLYIDGVFIDSVGRVPSGTLKYIGTSFDQVNSTNPQGFRAPLDEFIVFNSALTPTQITNIYNYQAAGKNWDNSTRAAVVCSDLLGLYKFEQTSFASNITDTSGSNNNGTNIGGSSIAAGKYCRGFDSTGSNSSSTTSNAFSTGLDLDSDVGVKGTISFWYKSNTNWNSGGYNSGGERTLFDASKDIGLGGGNKYFQLGIESNGRLRFTFEDSNDGDFNLYEPSGTVRSSNTWYYLTVTWNFTSDNFQMYVNGNLATSASINTNGAIKDFGAIIFGDNSSTYVANNNFSIASPYSANGQFDEVRIYKKVLTQTEIQTDMNDNGGCFNIDHYQIEHDGNGLTCMAETVTLKACTNASCSTLSTNSASVDFKVAGVTQSSPSFTGSTTVNFNHTVAETVALSLANASPTPTNATVCKNGTSTSCDMLFSDAGFRFLYGTAESTTIPYQISGKSFTDILKLQAVKNNNGVCTGLFTNNVSVKLAQKNILPTGTGGLDFTVNGAVISKHSTFTNTTLNFGTDSKATIINPTYNDAGQIQLYADYNIGGVHLIGNSNAFWVKPAKLVVTAKSGGTNLNNTIATGIPIHKAGQNFVLEVKALNFSGVVTPNYSPGQIQFKLQRTTPTTLGSVDGNITYVLGGSLITAISPIYQNVSLTSFNNGVSTYNAAKYSEVGLLNLDLQDINYGGLGAVAGLINGDAINIGRFIPDHFVLKSSAVTGSCNGFTYMDEPELKLNYQIEAQNFQNAITKNYTSNFVHSNVNLMAENANDGNELSARLSGASGTWLNGLYKNNNTPNAAKWTFSRTTTPDGPFDNFRVGIKLIDTDLSVLTNLDMNAATNNACTGIGDCDAKSLGTETKLRFGRLLINNAYGPETSDLPLPMTMQYWNGSKYVTNSLDNCTPFNSNPVANYTLSNAGLNPALPTNVNTSSGSGTFVSGLAEVLLSAPTNNAQGQIRYTYDATPAWLLGDWDGDGNFDNKPSAVASFGIFRGNDRIIYWREIHQ